MIAKYFAILFWQKRKPLQKCNGLKKLKID